MDKLICLLSVFAITFLLGCADNQNSFVGPEYSDKSDLYGKYCDDNCDFYVRLGDTNSINSELSGLSQYIIDKASTGQFDGYAFINKGGGVTGIGFWRISQIGKVLQSDHYPGVFFEKIFNGAQIQIYWEKTERGLEIWPDGTYIVRNFPEDFSSDGEILSDNYLKQFRGIDSTVSLEKR